MEVDFFLNPAHIAPDFRQESLTDIGVATAVFRYEELIGRERSSGPDGCLFQSRSKQTTPRDLAIFLR